MTPTPAAAEEETNVRVAARVRPLLPREKAAGCCSCVTVHAASRQLVVGTRRTFAFDVVFDESAQQAEVYEECVAPLLAGCMQGYNATILAYGQTGSGKTHTMGTGQANSQTGEDEGITPKVIRSSFGHFADHADEVSFKATCCYIEIYNEEIRDLLQPNAPKHLIQVRETADGVIQVAGIHSEVCCSAEEMMRCLVDGSVQRTTGATLMNEQSSRSHSIFTIIVEQRRRGRRDDSRPGVDGDEAGGAPAACEDDSSSRPTYRTAKFHLVDLAGSERAKRTGAVGSRFKESVSINAGLLALGNVISALGDPAKRGCHVPYRESKLTRLLQDGLGGNSRTLMIACASGADGDFEETLNTLKYANRARNIKNKPVVNQDPKVAQLAAMQDEIEALRSALQRASEASPTAPPPWAGLGCEADAAIGELTEKADIAERRGEELAARLEGAEAECEAVRRALAEVYGAVCSHLPTICHASSSSGASAGEGTAVKQALGAISASLQVARRVLGNAVTGGGAGTPAEAWLGQVPAPLALDSAAGDVRASGSDLPGYGDFPVEADVIGSDGLPAPSLEAPGFRTLSEVRRDSTVLIRKYLDEIKRLEAELALHRRRTKQLQEELQEAKEDLAKDEEIFEEKMQEMRSLGEQNAQLQSQLLEAMAAVGASPTSAGQRGAGWNGGGSGPGPPDRGAARCWEDRSGEAAAEERVDEAAHPELEESREVQHRLERELQALAQSVHKREEKIADLSRSEREWGSTKAQYQRRMEQLQAELGGTQRELSELHGQLQESEQLKEQTRQMEEEKRRLERLISEQEDCIRKKKQEFGRMRDLRQQDSKRIRELEIEVTQLASSQREKEARLQAERRREAQQISELQRRLVKEGQRVRELEKENLRQKEGLKSSQGPPRQRSATPSARWSGSGGTATGSGAAVAGSKEVGRPASVDPAARSAGGAGAPAGGAATASGSSSFSARAQQLEQKLDEYIRRQEAMQSLEEDQRKKDALVKKQQQYTSYRRKIATKDALEQQEAREQMEQLEAQLARMERELVEAAPGGDPDPEPAPRQVSASDPEVAQRARVLYEALAADRAELQRASQAKRSEGQGILHDIDERLEVLQDEIDFREARIAKARQLARPGASLDVELAGLSGEDARDLLCRYCEKIVRLRQRERQSLRRFAANEAQLQEKSRQVAELQQVLRSQNANASRYAAKVAKEYEARIRVLQQRLDVAQQRFVEQSGEDGPGNSDSSSTREARSSPSVAGDGEAAELQRLRRESTCLRTMNRELKRRVRGLMVRGEQAPACGSGGGGGSRPLGVKAVEAKNPLAASAPSGGSPVEELAGQVAQLMREKEVLAEENRRVLTQVRGLKQYNARYHNIDAAGVSLEASSEATAPHRG